MTATRGETVLSVENLRTYYDEGGVLSGPPVRAVDGVSLDIKRGETVGLVGESGCGKTTLGRTLAGYESPTEGTVTFDGTDVSSLDSTESTWWRRHCQMVFQDPESSLDDRMTVGEIVREPLDVHDWETRDARRRRVQGLLERVGLRPEHYYRYPHQFSGGQRQRVGIARALALEPEFLVLDEPVSALDVSVQAQILSLLADLQAEFGLTYLLIAHDLAVVRHVCDRVAVMYLGTLLEVGDADAVFESPANPYTRALLGAVPEPDPTADWDPPRLHGSPPDPRQPPTGCPFTTRCPEKIRPSEFDLTAETWEALELFRDVLRTRTERTPSVATRLKRALTSPAEDGIEEVRRELFEDVPVSDPVQAGLDSVLAAYRSDGPRAAVDRYVELFGGVCDTDYPLMAEPEAGQRSRCHHHRPAYSDRRGTGASSTDD
ncbi:ABC transporter ATP-binding protein [Halobaculum sp. EA56]|uniref:ABC transporter ATP-binding protein n=1 Tax=Halobaculum sp. EA56 TaxID=3421648 RepID=UPI003EB9224D